MNKSSPLFSFVKKYNLLILLVIFIIIASAISPNFFTFRNFFNLLQQSAIAGVIGMTMVCITGGIDLSVGSAAAFAGMVASILVKQQGWPVELAFPLTILMGACIGLFTGSVITRFRLPDIIATLAMLEILRGMSLLLTDGKPVFGLSAKFRFVGAKMLWGTIPVSGLIWIFLTIAAFLVLRYLPLGRSFYSIGGNSWAAYLSGVRVKWNKTVAYVISGALSAFAGIMLAAWLSTGQPNAARGIEMDAIASVVIGGTSLTGGNGGVIGTFGGVFLLTIITNILNLIGVPSYFQQICKGLIILIALIANNYFMSKE